MKRKYILIVFILLNFTSCIQDGSDTIILPEISESDIPEEIQSEWTIAIKCSEQEQIAIEAVMTTQKKTSDFTASGSGNDYDGEPIDMTVTGVYDKKYNTISAEVRYDFINSGTYRKDHFAVDLDYYTNGTYIDMIKIDESNPGGPYPSCDTQIKLFY